METVNGYLERLQSTEPKVHITEEMVRDYLGAFGHFVKTRNIPQIKRFIDSYVERVEVSQNHVKVTFKVAFTFFGDRAEGYCFTAENSKRGLKRAMVNLDLSPLQKRTTASPPRERRSVYSLV